MPETPLASTILSRFDDLPPQLQAAARFVLDNPEEVALLTTREQAKRAGVSPAALTRLAQRLGLDGYDDVRRQHAEALRARGVGMRGRARDLVAARREAGEPGFTRAFLEAGAENIHALARSEESAAALAAAADLLAQARTIYCLGRRSSFASAFLANYLFGLLGRASVLVEGPGDGGLDRLAAIGADDVLLAVSVRPNARPVREVMRYARERGARLVAITDGRHTTVARLADVAVPVRIETPSFFHATIPALAAVEALAALVAARLGDAALEAVAESESRLARFGAYDDDGG